MADITPQSVILGLPALQWQGLDAPPYDIAPISVRHNQSERKYPYVDGSGHDNTGRDPIQLTARLHFINTLALKSPVRLFPDLFEQWKNELLFGGAGDLRHPILGPVRARVVSWDVDLNANQSLAGAVVNVTWVDTIEDPAVVTDFQPLENNITVMALAADSALEKAGIDYPDGIGQPLADLLQQAEGFITLNANTLAGVVNQARGTIDQLVDVVSAADNALNFAAKDILIQLSMALVDLANKAVITARATSQVTYSFPQTCDAVARNVGNTTAEIMELNVSLLRSPQIPPSTAITYYTE